VDGYSEVKGKMMAVTYERREWQADVQNDPERRQYYYQEKLILEVTELICELMKQKGISKAELARKLGRSKSNMTQLLDGTTNMTLRTVSDTLLVLDSKLVVSLVPLESSSKQSPPSLADQFVFESLKLWNNPVVEGCSITEHTNTDYRMAV
jgi:antitoxin component HigA of HigAB toxin-antitoxin module